jgi:hypothetical protein
MASKEKKPAKAKAKPGPKAEVLKLEGDWKENIRKSMQTAKQTTKPT